MATIESFPLDDVQSYDRIKSAIQKGQFTPFLGAGASSLRPDNLDLERPPWQDVAIAIGLLRRRSSEERRDDIFLYLRSFSRDRLRLSEDQVDLMFPLGGTEEPVWDACPTPNVEGINWPGIELAEFQYRLADAATRLTRTFGERFSQTFPAVGQFGDTAVRVRPCSKARYKEILDSLLRLVDASRQISPDCLPRHVERSARRRHPCFEVELTYRKLIVMTYQLCDEDCRGWDSFKEWERRHIEGIEAVTADRRTLAAGNVQLVLSSLGWLSDLLWYSMRYWLPCYPTTAELAFDFTLAAETAPPTRAELAQAAEALGDEPAKLVARIREIFMYYERSIDRPSRFHFAVGAALQHAYALYRRRELTAKKAGVGLPASGYAPRVEDAEGNEDKGRPMETQRLGLPIAFTTNFDRALERVFERQEIDHYVVYPIRRAGGAEVFWAIKSVSGERAQPRIERCGNELGRELLAGPVIVKLHGSPLDDPPEGDEHWLVLSESGYLEALEFSLTKLPSWIGPQLAKANRSLWFLGYSVADWNVRLRLWEHLRRSRKETPQSLEDEEIRPLRDVVDRKVDSFRMAIFGPLKIKVRTGDLNRLAAIIPAILQGLRSDELSEDVKALLNEARHA